MKFIKIIYHSQFNEATLDMLKTFDIHQFVDCQRICGEGRVGGAWRRRLTGLMREVLD